MEYNKTRIKSLEEFLRIDADGNIFIDNNDEPTNEQIGAEVRRFARQYAKGKEKIQDDVYRLIAPHPMIGDIRGTQKKRSEWMEQNGWSDEQFDRYVESRSLMQRG